MQMADLEISCLVVARLLLLLNAHSLAKICHVHVDWIKYKPIKNIIFVAATLIMHP